MWMREGGRWGAVGD